MENVDFKTLGFRCGVEIHQQLFTEKKLFCRCPAGKYSRQYDSEVLRHMRPTLSEMGTYDGTALMEFKTNKEIIYRLNQESVCTYELDDTPPFLINEDALNIAIEIALLLSSNVVDEMHIARKQYLDGSIPTGFQRTAIVGMGGEIPFKGKKINIRQFSIEEDACREVSDHEHTITFLTDRLGMPLVEIVTEPDMETPEEAAAVVRELGRLMRVTKKVRRGIGSVRQDVNVSIKGSRRVEIKGVSRYQYIPKLTGIEALRQKALLKIMEELKKRKINLDNIAFEKTELTDELKKSSSLTLKAALENSSKIFGIKCAKLNGILNWPTQPGKTFAHEISGRVSVIACLDQTPNIIHTDDWPKYKGSEKDLDLVKAKLNANKDDVIIIVWGPRKDIDTALGEIEDRFKEALNGVPHETRQARPDGTTDFERILPGADRMYPDTDHPPVNIPRARVENISKNLSEKPWDIEKKYKEWGMPEDSIDKLPVSDYVDLIDKLSKKLKPKDLRTVGIVLTQKMKALSREGISVYDIPKEKLFDLFIEFSRGSFKQNEFPEKIKDLC